jgi:tRNA pseudouridine synthase 10
VEFLTDGGLYIKELLHGDEGRTEPSLSSLLGTKVNVENLDVTGVMDSIENLKDQG